MKAEYIAHSGDDLMVVNAARVSFNNESVWEDPETGDWILSDRDFRLIQYLARNNHWTPFAHPQITLRITAPIFIRTQCFKHKQGFVENEVSRRYVDEPPEFYQPEVWRQRCNNAKQGSTKLGVKIDEYFNPHDEWREVMRVAESAYQFMMECGVCPEQARMVLPQAMYTQWYWTGSLAAYARFYKQRTDPHAQQEIQELAKMVGEVIQPLFPASWKALTQEKTT